MPFVTMNIHQVSQAGFGSGTNDLYDRARPSYQPFALDFILERVPKEDPLNVVEIASGTGIFTRALLAHPEWNRRMKHLRAVEPSQGMRDVFDRTVKDSRITLSDGVFQATGMEDGWADLVVVAQAFHWCPDFNAASAEISRILKPRGTVAFIWNLEDREAAKWVGQVRDLIETHEQGTPQFRRMLWRHLFDTPSYQNYFLPPEEKSWKYVLEATQESVIDRASSKSYIAILSEDVKSQLKEDLRKVISHGDKVWVDKSKGVFYYPYTSWVVTTQKK